MNERLRADLFAQNVLLMFARERLRGVAVRSAEGADRRRRRVSDVEPRSWVRYWTAGVVVGPIVAVAAAATGDFQLSGLGALIAAVSFGMVGFWRQKDRDARAGQAD